MSERQEPYLIRDIGEFTPLQINNNSSEKRLLDHLRQFQREGCRGVVVIFDGSGYTVFKMSREKRA